jgi:hypothetical protein
MDDKKVPKSSDIFRCEICDYITYRKSQMDRHYSTDKHKRMTLDDKKVPKSSASYFCNCGKEYKHRQGLWKHKKMCADLGHQKEEDNSEKMIDQNKCITPISANNKNDLINYLIKENQEFKNLILEIVKKDTTNNSYNTTNSHNKAFNLNFFLNETCKDAMNITDFVESIKLQLTDLERVGELGYVEGISNIIVKNLNELDITQRPVHCTDKKRETMYVKDENTWEKDEEKKKMHKLVKKVADKNMRLLPEYREKHPDYIKASSLISDKYNQIFLESLGGSGDNNFEKEEKIIQKVSREVFVQKAI